MWAGPMVTASGVIVAWTDGTLMMLGPDMAAPGRAATAQGLAAPWMEAGVTWVRTWTSLMRWG